MLRPDDAVAHDQLGVALAGQGRLDEAIAELRRALQIDPNDPEVRAHLAGGSRGERGADQRARNAISFRMKRFTLAARRHPAVPRDGAGVGADPGGRRHARLLDPAVRAAAQLPGSQQAGRARVLHELHAARYADRDRCRRRSARCSAATNPGAGLPPWKCASAITSSTTRIRSAATRAAGPRVSQISLPLTDDEKPIRLALWRATDRTFKQASEALDARQDQRRREGEGRGSRAGLFARGRRRRTRAIPVTYTLDTKAWEARLRRISAPFADEPLVFRSDVSLSVESDNRYYVNSEGTQVATGDVACRLFIQAVTKADDGMELPLYTSYFATSPAGLPDEKELIADVREDDRPARAPAQGAARRSVLGPGDSVGPRRRRVLPRDLRPSRRSEPPAERRRRADVRQPRRPAGAAGRF